MENPFEIIIEKLNSIKKLLLEITNRSTPGDYSNNSGDLMTLKNVMEYLSISSSTIYKLSSTMEIPHIKRGNRLYFQKEEINKWLAKSKIKTKAEIEEEANDYLLKRKIK